MQIGFDVFAGINENAFVRLPLGRLVAVGDADDFHLAVDWSAKERSRRIQYSCCCSFDGYVEVLISSNVPIQELANFGYQSGAQLNRKSKNLPYLPSKCAAGRTEIHFGVDVQQFHRLGPLPKFGRAHDFPVVAAVASAFVTIGRDLLMARQRAGEQMRMKVSLGFQVLQANDVATFDWLPVDQDGTSAASATISR